MPFVRVDGLNIYYEIHGEGKPLVMIMGLGVDSSWWPPEVIEGLARHFQVVIFDNRGAGRSSKPRVKYTIRDMAEDTVKLMDYLGIDRAHILGVSMGGMIAQEIALTFPERVEKLVLVVTTPGLRCGEPPGPEAMEHLLLDRSSIPPEVLIRKTLEALFPKAWLEENMDKVSRLAERALRYVMPQYAYERQLEAVMEFDAWDRVHNINKAVLVIGGGADIILPPKNSVVLAERIPGARLVIYEGAGHGLILQEADRFVSDVVSFLLDK